MCQITRNAAKCKECDDEIESKTRWDFVSCKCGNIFVDGGLEYLRRGWNSKGEPDDAYEDTSTFKDCMSHDCRYKEAVVTDDTWK